jgi:Fe2+ transport system protein FeoA
MRLDKVPNGRSATILTLTHQGPRLRRLLEMGFSEGSQVTVVRRAPLGDPLEVSLGDFHLSLRLADAALIEVKL